VDDRAIASGLALLLDNVTLTVDWPWLLGAEPELYGPEAVERLGKMSTMEWIWALESDPREISDTAGEIDLIISSRYGRIGRLLEMCAQLGVVRAIAELDPPRA
jgi:hypothetical protein